MRAAAQNPVSSRLVGIRVGWMLALRLGTGRRDRRGGRHDGGADRLPRSQHDERHSALWLRGALLGGIDNPWGAVLGGFFVGVLENIAGAYVVGTELKLTVALVIIVGVLLFKPAGLFGRTLVTRV